jgi:hypothetical protein
MWNSLSLERAINSRRPYKGENNPFFNKSHSKDAKDKMSKARLGTNPRRRAEPIVLIHENGKEEIFASSKDACEKYNLSRGNLSGVLNSKVPHTKGFKAKRLK